MSSSVDDRIKNSLTNQLQQKLVMSYQCRQLQVHLKSFTFSTTIFTLFYQTITAFFEEEFLA